MEYAENKLKNWDNMQHKEISVSELSTTAVYVGQTIIWFNKLITQHGRQIYATWCDRNKSAHEN